RGEDRARRGPSGACDVPGGRGRSAPRAGRGLRGVKVLFLAHSFPRYAADPVGSFVLRLATALRDVGVTVRVVAPSAPGLAATDEFEGIRVDRFRYAPARLETLAYAGTMRDQVRASWGARLALAFMI